MQVPGGDEVGWGGFYILLVSEALLVQDDVEVLKEVIVGMRKVW